MRRVEFDIKLSIAEYDEKTVIYPILSKGLQIGTLTLDKEPSGMDYIKAEEILLKKTL